MSEISSGLVAVAWMNPNEDMSDEAFSWHKDTSTGHVESIVRLSDAEAVISQKDAEIIEQCRLNGMGAEREAALLGKVERQSTALKLARDALTEAKGWNWLDDDLPSRIDRQVKEALAAIDALGE